MKNILPNLGLIVYLDSGTVGGGHLSRVYTGDELNKLLCFADFQALRIDIPRRRPDGSLRE